MSVINGGNNVLTKSCLVEKFNSFISGLNIYIKSISYRTDHEVAASNPADQVRPFVGLLFQITVLLSG